MEGAVDKGLVRSIGLSNYSPEKIQRWHSNTRIPVSVNQVSKCRQILQMPDRSESCPATHRSASRQCKPGMPLRWTYAVAGTCLDCGIINCAL